MKTLKPSSIILGLCLLITNLVLAQNEVSQREVIALLELKAKTKGHLWTHQWDQSKPIATWYGVTVKDGKVVGLDLSNNNLQGKIPITIGNLRHLEHLNLSKNNITGKIPGLFKKFKNLKSVNLANNQLAGNIPNTINKLVSLQQLDLGNNKLEGTLPTSIIELANLNTLAVANNDLNGAMPAGINKLKKLKELRLANNRFTNFDGLRSLSKQQLVLTDVYVQNGQLMPIDFTNNQGELSKLEFEDFK